MPENDKLRVALIGPGRIAAAHLPAIVSASDVATLVAVAGLPHEKERTEDLAGRYAAERAVHDAEAVILADDIDAVVLTVPNHVHAPLTKALVENGKHVLIEKPLATSLADADTMIDAAAANGRVLMVAHCRRFFEGAQTAKKRVADLGRPLTLTHTLGVFAEHVATQWWKSASDTGGLALGLNGPHVLDTMLWLISSRPTRVYAQTRRLRDLWEGEDEAMLMVEFEDGSLASGYISLNTRVPVNDRLINGPQGSMRLTDDRNLWVNNIPAVQEEVVPYINGDSSFDNQFREFVDAIATGRTPQSSAEEARTVVALMEAAHTSQATGQPVDLDAYLTTRI
ncbi:probable NADH-dependent oxidoreductase (plasmid) [Rhodococcus jostii RHA1]|jgi:predicted dehydrogenase|uniref:Predicted dehydrogenase n=3 Tax=Rhodococcus TaxID=1827 RepID=A0A1H4LQJ8_9NOCA|nr:MULTISPECIES: Gfo/Idh/MocA family oxidoreductase [Rhodococcus]ABG99257.1 probable NADH-dependent oxidoreductase [Rhodococcus jostii RHA1]EID80165.1 NADH-dependent oxidoreductase [Rhodococcus opacus RKJ300 = JCM 13270]QQZ18512.1 Gfo/Idh/MocA family oxidoreductase [Rhodococcus sp. 21391]SEB72866.1 Predicted dehydrogenase [Rhodococcus koreensis]